LTKSLFSDILMRMKTTVIIPAYNEERHIGRTLESLPADLIDPIVAINGSTDKTAEIVDSYGAKMHNMPERGKMPAIQETLRRLGRDSLGPIFILDGDTRPIAPRLWHEGMLNALSGPDNEKPSAVGALVWYRQPNLLNSALRYAVAAKRAFGCESMDEVAEYGLAGPNMGIHLRSEDALEEILSLPHYWPCEDRAIMIKILSLGGVVKQSANPKMTVSTPASDSFVPLSTYRKLGVVEARKLAIEMYIERAAPGSIPFTPNPPDTVSDR
jgi:glycosyltransferase involved in cell wall biosynthesis